MINFDLRRKYNRIIVFCSITFVQMIVFICKQTIFKSKNKENKNTLKINKPLIQTKQFKMYICIIIKSLKT